ncbi:MAG: anthranilate synthase component II [Anaerolineales bacterium]
MVIVIDNYDSFTHNLVQYLGELGAQVKVFRNDHITIEALWALHPTHLVISPGPGVPGRAGISIAAIRKLGPDTPTLGVCLGHQAIAAAFGGQVRRASELVHGKTSRVYHQANGIFAGLPSPLEATRYHSLIVDEPLPDCLQPTAFTHSGVLMAVRHKAYPIYGVQFHPESILTQGGKQLLRNFLTLRNHFEGNQRAKPTRCKATSTQV